MSHLGDHPGECGICGSAENKLHCHLCVTKLLQQKRITHDALQADVAVLRRKSETIMESSRDKIQAQERWMDVAQAIEEKKKQILSARQHVCQERIQLAEVRQNIETKSAQLNEQMKKVKKVELELSSLHVPLVAGLYRHTTWLEEDIRSIRQTRLIELFDLFAIKSNTSHTRGGIAGSTSGYCFTITDLPLPRSGQYRLAPAEVIAAALGRVIQLLTLMDRYYLPLEFRYRYPMVYNSSFSTIGTDSGEGAGCHTLYPDDSLGFDRGVDMLERNIVDLCQSQGVETQHLFPPHDILGNLQRLREHYVVTRSSSSTYHPFQV